MPQRIKITRVEVYEACVGSTMQMLHSAMFTKYLITDCNPSFDPGHYCIYDKLMDAGALHLYQGDWTNLVSNMPPQVRPHPNSRLFTIEDEGFDLWAKQWLCRNKPEEGPLYQLCRELFRDHPSEYQDWSQLVGQAKLTGNWDEEA